ncbi:hypothetical protein ACFWGI_37670 [Streptomyces niveus]|uniref:hypothetical protein n=1 Tax=Streptomyces niveus TaxID=193462 RepID=UPI003666182B
MTTLPRRFRKAIQRILAIIAAVTAVLNGHTTAPSGPGTGHSFNTAIALSPGTITRQLTVGDLYFYRVDLKPGQRLQATATITIPRGYAPGDPTTEFMRIGIHNPLRNGLLCKKDTDREMLYSGRTVAKNGGDVTVECSIGTPGEDDAVDTAGSHYVQLGIGRPGNLSKGTTLPLRLTVAIGTGIAPQPSEPFTPGTPSPGAATPSADPNDSGDPAGASATGSERADGIPRWALPMAAVLSAAATVMILAAFSHRRKVHPPSG